MTEKKEPVKKVSPRRRARECAVQALYSWALSGNAPEQVELTFVVDQDLKGVDKPYFSRLFRQTVANVDAVDFSMSHYLDRTLDELDPIEKAILRLAVYELQFEKAINTLLISVLGMIVRSLIFQKAISLPLPPIQWLRARIFYLLFLPKI